MSYLTSQNIGAILPALGEGFAFAAFFSEERPGWATVPANAVVYYSRQGRHEEGNNAQCGVSRAEVCVLLLKQGLSTDSVTRTSPKAVALGETGEEALPPSTHTAVWDASLVLKPAQPLLKHSSLIGGCLLFAGHHDHCHRS